ncbi:MAG: UDP-N-acetylglucosamine 2-epimerase (hydrolyzing) [Lachnospiraceae bacterium]|nr:UDP-N-acetylglucosamine 2-epimerase (hydrolyzing) [Lachnospiraceae bacterium]
MKKIAIITATRAEYGLLKPVVESLRKYESKDFKVEVIVTGTHLSGKHGNTITEIEKDNIHINYKIYIPVDSSDANDISNNQAETLVKFTNFFIEKKYDAVVILGDRYEALSIAIAAGNTNTPLFHLCGGDTTEGASDEWIRHSITKMSYLHFVTNEESKKRVVQLGEDPCRVFNYGSTSIDNILNIEMLTKEEALRSVGVKKCQYAVCTYHPVTIDDKDIVWKVCQFLNVAREFPNIEFIVTKSNADQGGSNINMLLDKEEKNIDNVHVFASIGTWHYLSLVKYCEFVLGNSSSGIIEAPALHVPTVNIGDRQRGRQQCESIINCGESTKEIVAAINHVMDKEFKEACKAVGNPYGDGTASAKIAEKIIEIVKNGRINLKKKFYNL